MKPLIIAAILFAGQVLSFAAAKHNFIVLISANKAMTPYLTKTKTFMEEKLIKEMKVAALSDTITLFRYGKTVQALGPLDRADAAGVQKSVQTIKKMNAFETSADIADAILKARAIFAGSEKTAISKNDVRNIMIVFTAGANTPAVKDYYAKSGALTVTYLKQFRKEMRRGKWKLVLVGLGSKTEVKSMAMTLNASAVVIDQEKITQADFNKKLVYTLNLVKRGMIYTGLSQSVSVLLLLLIFCVIAIIIIAYKQRIDMSRTIESKGNKELLNSVAAIKSRSAGTAPARKPVAKKTVRKKVSPRKSVKKKTTKTKPTQQKKKSTQKKSSAARPAEKKKAVKKKSRS